MSLESRKPGADKMIDSFAFKCSPDLKERIVRLAMTENMDDSEFVRQAIETEIEKRRAVYEALHGVFGGDKENPV